MRRIVSAASVANCEGQATSTAGQVSLTMRTVTPWHLKMQTQTVLRGLRTRLHNAPQKITCNCMVQNGLIAASAAAANPPGSSWFCSGPAPAHPPPRCSPPAHATSHPAHKGLSGRVSTCLMPSPLPVHMKQSVPVCSPSPQASALSLPWSHHKPARAKPRKKKKTTHNPHTPPATLMWSKVVHFTNVEQCKQIQTFQPRRVPRSKQQPCRVV